MIEIKNKIYNSKERKKQIRFNKYMTLKKTIRLKFKNLIPLNENEKILYTDEYEFKDKIEKIDKESKDIALKLNKLANKDA